MRAKALLQKKGIAFEEINVRADPAKLAEMQEKSGGKQTIPQIFIDDKYVGDCETLYALDAAGKLDPLLAA
jgi:glutaredoxin 3